MRIAETIIAALVLLTIGSAGSFAQEGNWNGFVQKEKGGAWEKLSKFGRPNDTDVQARGAVTRGCITDRHKIQRTGFPEKPRYAGKAVNTKTGAEIVVICSDAK